MTRLFANMKLGPCERAGALLPVLFGLMGGQYGCSDNQHKIVVVLIDRSASTVQDRSLYERAAERILGGLQPGDRLVAAWITEKSAVDFGQCLDRELPPEPRRGWTGENSIAGVYRKRHAEWEVKYKQARQELDQEFRKMLRAGGSSPRTFLIESLRIAGEILVSDPRPRKVLYVLSDMVEESDVISFERRSPTPEITQKLIREHRRKGILPRLKGVRVCVAGAISSPLGRATAIEQFWRAYFAACEATLPPGAYSRVVPRCE